MIDVDASDEEREVPRRPLDECTVCFEGFRDDTAHDFCGACGRNYHEACRDRWFAFKKAACCGVTTPAGRLRRWRPMPRSRAKRVENLRAFQPDVAAERDV